MNRRLKTGFALAGGLWLTACIPLNTDEPIPLEPLALDAATATTYANTRFSEHAQGLAATVKTLERSQLISDALPGESTGECPEGDPGLPPPACDGGAESSALDLSEEVRQIEEWVEQHVFNEAAVESSDGTTVVYRLLPERFCPEQEDDTGAITRDEDCVKLLTDMPVRVTVRSYKEGDLDLSFTAGSHHLADAELYASHVSLTADLPGFKAAVQQAGGILGENVEGFPERFAGKVKLAAVRHAAEDYSLELGVAEALNVGSKAPTDPEYVDVQVGVSDPVLSGRLSAETGDLTLDVAVNALKLALAADLVFGGGYSETCDENGCTPDESTPKEGVVAFELPGLSFSGRFNADTDSGAVEGIKVAGEPSASLDGESFLRLAVTSAATAGFSISVDQGEDETAVTVEGGVEGKATHDFAVLDSVLDEDDRAPDFLRSGWSSIAASAPKLTFVGTDVSTVECSGEGEEEVCSAASTSTFQVVEGSLTFASSVTDPVVVSAPQCLVENEEAPEEPAHPFEEIAAGACDE